MHEQQIELADEAATERLGRQLALSGINGLIFLRGDLGAGKTTLARGFLQALGHQGAVKSPTYTLIEPYQLADQDIYHMDIYRLSGAEELEHLGIRDLLAGDATLLVEWPERAEDILKNPDVEISLNYAQNARLAEIRSLKPLSLLP